MNGTNGTTPRAIQTELAELKEVIGKLWKAVDAFKISAAQTDKHTQEQIAAWTETNLNLLKLLSAKTEETERLARNYSKLTSYLNGFDGQFQGLEGQINSLSSSLKDLKPGSSYGHEIKQIQSTVENLRYNLQLLDSRLKDKNQNKFPFGGGGWSASFWAAVGMSLVLTGYMFLLQAGLNQQFTYLRDRVTWSLIKLERIERGLEPK